MVGDVFVEEIVELVENELDITADLLWFYTDSKVFLGYMHNQTRRFCVYVSNRV